MQEVVVYRNPLEALIWHSLMDGGVWIVVAFLLLALLWALVYSKWENVIRWLAQRKTQPIYIIRQKWWVLSEGWVASIVTAAVAFALHVWYVS